ncbi:MAG: pantoate--beta-alanine ligase [Phycisphaerales bacterium]|nr:pantoate--beta-alanine ligase [Phycisphaerales bacterium]
MHLATSHAELRATLSTGAVFVPTMGALHEGHASLIRHAAAVHQGPVVVSIFVNPTQFNDPADFARYPKTLDADLDICRRSGATHVYAPTPQDVYPADAPIPVPPLPRVATAPGLEDKLRPGHFAGVCQVVRRLFDLVQPAAALFGEKDWQQLQVLSAMTRETGLPIRIIPGPTIREPDGLAMSSRNRFLTADERPRAASISRALREAASKPTPAAAEAHMRDVIQAAGLEVQYAVVRDAQYLEAPISGRPRRALIAAKLGSVRLIDNAAWPDLA